jgi:hypothetical protein
VAPCLAGGDRVTAQSAGTRVREQDVCWATGPEQVHAYYGSGLRQEGKPKVKIRGRGGREFCNLVESCLALLEKAPYPVKEVPCVWDDHGGVFEATNDGFQLVERDRPLVDDSLDVERPGLVLVLW